METEIPGLARKDRPRLPIVKVSKISSYYFVSPILESKSFLLVARSRYFAGWDLWAVKTAWVGTPVTRIPCCNSVLAGSRLRMEIREWRKFLGERVLVLFSIVRIV